MTEAQKTEELLQRLDEAGIGEQEEVYRNYVEAILDEGTLYPNATLTSNIDLPLGSRIKGKHKQRIDPVISMGILIGIALERDIPSNSDIDEEFKEGNVVLPGGNDE
jgi:hypothetical protein